jgi:hypothetical protein
MASLVALQGNAPQFDTMGSFAQGAQARHTFDDNQITLARKGLENIGSIALGAMGGKLDGPVNPEQFEQGLDLLEQNGLDVKSFRGRPEVAPIAARASMTALQQLQNARGEQEFELAMKKFQAEMSRAAAGTDETFAMQPTYYRVQLPDGTTAVKFGQLGNKGTFKETALPEGAEPAIPVQQLNTETGFTPVTKFGDKPEDAAVTPIDNAGAAFDTAVGKGKGELAVELPAKKGKAQGALNALERQWQVVGSDIDRAIEQSKGDFPTTGIFSIANAVPGTPGYDLAQTLTTIKANIGFDRLQEMRNNSPTGGALGAVSEKENELLQAVNGALAEGQSQEQLERNLRRIKDLQAQILTERRAAYERDFGEPAPASLPVPGATPAQAPGSPGGGAPQPGSPGGEVDWTDYFGDLQE